MAYPPFQMGYLNKKDNINADKFNDLIANLNRVFMDLYRGTLYNSQGMPVGTGGTFTDISGKLVSVSNGIIVNIK